jgi:hypothetical protein
VSTATFHTTLPSASSQLKLDSTPAPCICLLFLVLRYPGEYVLYEPFTLGLNVLTFYIIAPLSLVKFKMREVISVHVGQAGVQIGNACCKYCAPCVVYSTICPIFVKKTCHQAMSPLFPQVQVAR